MAKELTEGVPADLRMQDTAVGVYYETLMRMQHGNKILKRVQLEYNSQNKTHILCN